MAICSCIVQCLPGQGAAVAAHLADLDNVEVHGGPGDTLVVTLEDEMDGRSGHPPLRHGCASRINAPPGPLSVRSPPLRPGQGGLPFRPETA
jgi:hypothetical protein